MEQNKIKALYIIINAGFADDVMDLVREAGASGATIFNARGTGSMHKAFMGISVDSEKEVILTLVNETVAEKIIESVKEKAGITTAAHGICFMLPVENMTKLADAKQE